MPRPKGRKNNATLLKEGEIAKALALCEGHAALEAPAIVVAMAERAKAGDVSAAKLILDRVYPAMRQNDGRGAGVQGITINITSDSGETNGGIDQKGSETGEREPDPAGGAERFHHEGVEVLAFGRKQEGER